MSQTGLVSSLEKLVDAIRRSGSFKVEFATTAADTRLSNEKSIILFRMIQESINNVIKHAGATEMSLYVQEIAGYLIMTITDNGKGFDTSKIENQSQGLGISNIFTRAKMIGAEVAISSGPGKGTTISIKIKPDL